MGNSFDAHAARVSLSPSRRRKYAQIAQSVEQRTENPCVVGSIPTLGTSGSGSGVEHRLAKARVASSNLVCRSKRRHSQAVRQRSATPLPPVQIWVAPPNFNSHFE